MVLLSVLPVGLLQAWASVELAIVSPITHPAQRVHDVRLHEFRRSRIPRNADREFNKMDYFVVKSLRNWQFRRGGQRPTRRKPFTGRELYGMGLHELMGTVKYPAQATPRRSSLSRVPENGTHGLKGDVRNGLAKPAPR